MNKNEMNKVYIYTNIMTERDPIYWYTLGNNHYMRNRIRKEYKQQRKFHGQFDARQQVLSMLMRMPIVIIRKPIEL